MKMCPFSIMNVRPFSGTGNNLGLTLVLDVNEKEYFCSSTNSYGFKMLLHSPNELPKIAYYGSAIANGYESRVVIVPTLSEASDSVRKVPRRVRQCLYENENYLSFYRYKSFFVHFFCCCKILKSQRFQNILEEELSNRMWSKNLFVQLQLYFVLYAQISGWHQYLRPRRWWMCEWSYPSPASQDQC